MRGSLITLAMSVSIADMGMGEVAVEAEVLSAINPAVGWGAHSALVQGVLRPLRNHSRALGILGAIAREIR